MELFKTGGEEEPVWEGTWTEPWTMRSTASKNKVGTFQVNSEARISFSRSQRRKQGPDLKAVYILVRRWDFILIATRSHWRVFSQILIKYFGHWVENKLHSKGESKNTRLGVFAAVEARYNTLLHKWTVGLFRLTLEFGLSLTWIECLVYVRLDYFQFITLCPSNMGFPWPAVENSWRIYSDLPPLHTSLWKQQTCEKHLTRASNGSSSPYPWLYP